MEEIENAEYLTLDTPELSDWNCYLFGSDDRTGIVWTPTVGNVPNWFWRWMQYLFFGNLWIKRK